MANYRIERATAQDFLNVANLDRVSWGDQTFIVDGEHTWRIWCEYAYVLVARDPSADGRIVGALLRFVGNESLDILHKIFVDDSQRGKGVGSQLMRVALQDAAKPMMLTVDPSKAAAIALYERFGFEKRERVDGFYRPDEDRYLMVCQP